MKIEEYQITNFKGVRNASTQVTKFTTLVGKNGVGKTSTLEAIRFALTGVTPDGAVVTVGTPGCSVSVKVANNKGEMHEYRRAISDKGVGSVWMDGAKSTQKAVSQALETHLGIPVDNIALTSSADLLKAMKPKEFSSFILGYIPNKAERAELVNATPDPNPGLRGEVEEAISNVLPKDGITLSMIDDAYNTFKAYRKDFKDEAKAQDGQMSVLPKEDPGYDVEKLRKRLAQLADIKRAREEYAQKKRAYDSAVLAKRNWEKEKEELAVEVAKYPSTRPNPLNEKQLIETLASLNKSYGNQVKTLAGVNAALDQLRITQEALSKPICPISPLIVCHENKTVAIKEIEDSIVSTEAGLAALNEEMAKTQEQIDATKNAIAEANAASVAYEKRCALARSLTVLTENEPKIPAEPEIVAAGDEKETAEINAQIKKMEQWETYRNLLQKHAGCLNKVEVYEILCKAFAENGPVKQEIVKKYLNVFDKIVNARSKKFNPTFSFMFVADDGVKCLMSKDGKTFCSFEELSGGERAYMLFILLDMLNQLTGTKILMLDELNVMDTDVLDTLLAFVKGNESDYDHIFLSCVDFPAIRDLLKKHGLI